jgi:hypothetical protein
VSDRWLPTRPGALRIGDQVEVRMADNRVIAVRVLDVAPHAEGGYLLVGRREDDGSPPIVEIHMPVLS